MPSNAGDVGLIPGRGNKTLTCCGETKPTHHYYWAHAVWNLCSATGEACSLQLEKTHVPLESLCAAQSQFPDQESNPYSPSGKVQSFSHWITREVPKVICFIFKSFYWTFYILHCTKNMYNKLINNFVADDHKGSHVLKSL